MWAEKVHKPWRVCHVPNEGAVGENSKCTAYHSGHYNVSSTDNRHHSRAEHVQSRCRTGFLDRLATANSDNNYFNVGTATCAARYWEHYEFPVWQCGHSTSATHNNNNVYERKFAT